MVDLPSPQETGVPDDMSHNGWTNRSTWQVGLWLDNEEPLYRAMQAFARRGNVTAESTKAWYVERIAARVSDDINLSTVNWQEIVDDCVLPSIDDEGPADLNFEGDPTRNGAFR